MARFVPLSWTPHRRWLAPLLALLCVAAESEDGARGLTVGVTGCTPLMADGTCELPSTEVHELAFWLPADAPTTKPSLHTTADVRATEVQWLGDDEDGSGLGFVVRVELRLEKDADLWLELGSARRRFGLRKKVAWPWEQAASEMSPAEAVEALARRRPIARGAERVAVLRELARHQWSLGQWQAAAATLAECAEHAERLGQISESHHRWVIKGFIEATNHDFEAARRSLARAAGVRGLPRDVIDVAHETRSRYVLGVLENASRKWPDARRAYTLATAWARRGADQLRARIAVAHAYVEAHEGRPWRSIQHLKREVDAGLARKSACFRGVVLSALGWHELLTYWMSERSGYLADAERHLTDAVGTLTDGCADRQLASRARMNVALGLCALERRDDEAARRALQQSLHAEGDSQDWVWQQVLAAELALRGGDSNQAERVFENVRQHAESRLLPDVQWRALEGLGRTLLQAGNTQAAIARFEEAERLVDSGITAVRVDSGLLGFLTLRSMSSQGLVDALVTTGEHGRAFDVARRARRRALVQAVPTHTDDTAERTKAWQQILAARSALDAGSERLKTIPQDELEALQQELRRARRTAQRALREILSSDAALGRANSPLRTPSAGEALLMWIRGQQHWHGFLRTEDGLTYASHAADTTPDWIAPFEDRLATTSRLTVLGHGAFEQVDVHALPFHGQPLGEQMPVAYALDVASEWTEPTVRRVLIAADGSGDLPRVAREAERVAARYAAHGFQIGRLSAHELQREALERAARTTDLLHYAGHARFDGVEGWDGFLPLNRGQLSVRDVLTWRDVPPVVLLSACDGATSATMTGGVGIGLAQAYLLAGSQSVIAPLSAVEDGHAMRFSLAFASAFTHAGNVGAAYQAAQRQVRSAGADKGAPAFRWLVP